ncbi:MAG: magnesium/cobalt transporter CorA [archaeon]
MIEIFMYDHDKNEIIALDIKNLPEKKDKLLWVDVTSINKEEAEILRSTFDLHPLTVEDLSSWNTRVKVEEFNGYLLSVFYSIKNSKKIIELEEIDYVLGNNYIISNHKNTLDVTEELKKDRERLASLFKKGPDFIMHRLLDKEIDNFFPVLEHLDDELEDIEEKVIKRPRPELMTQVLKLKRTLRGVKRTSFQQREKISYLAKNNYKFISKKSIPYFRDVYDHAIRVSDSIDNYREAIGETFDAYMSAVNNSMNEVMKMLSMIATIALPMTVISGIYGTNFQILPGASYKYGFWIMIGGMCALCAFMLHNFRKRKWM